MAFYRVWLGRATLAEALQRDQVRLDGAPADLRAFPQWFAWSPMADAVRAALPAQSQTPARQYQRDRPGAALADPPRAPAPATIRRPRARQGKCWYWPRSGPCNPCLSYINGAKSAFGADIWGCRLSLSATHGRMRAPARAMMIAGRHLTLVTERDESLEAFEAFKRTLADGAAKFPEHVVGFPGGHKTVNVHWHGSAGIWGLFVRKQPLDQERKPLRRFWIAFGVDDPHQYSSLNITVE